MIKDKLGNMGRDLNNNKILEPSEIDMLAGSLTRMGGKKSLASIHNSGKKIEDKKSFKTDTLENVLDNINNGRVADINDTSGIKPQLGSHIVLNSDNRYTAVKGIVEETALSDYFFSTTNTKIIQDTLRYKVFQITNMVIGPQSSNELYIIMRSILLQHANFKVSQFGLIDEIKKLNELVLQYSVKEVSSNLLQYQGYLSDLSKNPTPMDRPSFTERQNYTYDTSNTNI